MGGNSCPDWSTQTNPTPYISGEEIMAQFATRKNGAAAKAQTVARRKARAAKAGMSTNKSGRKVR